MTITIEGIFAVLGAIAAVVAGVKGILFLFTPAVSFSKWKKSTDAILAEHTKYLENDKVELEELTKDRLFTMQFELALLNHMIDGNGVEKMKNLRDELQAKIFEDEQ